MSTAPAPLDERGYWALADAMQGRMDAFWDPDSDTYQVGGGGADPSVERHPLPQTTGVRPACG